MRGSDKRSGSLFSYVDLEARVRPDHPLRAIRHFADGALEALTVGFGELYSSTGRPSIPPERVCSPLPSMKMKPLPSAWLSKGVPKDIRQRENRVATRCRSVLQKC